MENRSIIQSNFIIANRDLINKFRVNSAILLGELYGRYNYFKKRNQLKWTEPYCLHNKNNEYTIILKFTIYSYFLLF